MKKLMTAMAIAAFAAPVMAEEQPGEPAVDVESTTVATETAEQGTVSTRLREIDAVVRRHEVDTIYHLAALLSATKRHRKPYNSCT